MNAKQKIDRRLFVQGACGSVLALLGFGAMFATEGCAGGGSSYGGGSTVAPASGGNCNTNGTQLATTGATESHAHTIQLTAAQIFAADTSAIFVTSSTGHSHPVQLTAGQFAALQANQGVSLNTGPGGDGHNHAVTFNCA